MPRKQWTLLKTIGASLAGFVLPQRYVAVSFNHASSCNIL